MRFSAYQKKRRDILFEIFEKYPDLSSRGTAAVLLKNYPEYFRDFEEARDLVRTYRGVKGIDNRNHLLIKKYYR